MAAFHLLMVVWGEAYIETMLDVAIPSLLFAGNLPALVARHDCRVVLFVRPTEEARIRQSPPMVRLAAAAPVDYVHIDPDAAPEPYAAMNAAHHLGCVAAKAAGAKAIFLCPDGILADGSLSRIGLYAEQGKVAVICPGPLLTRETALPAMREAMESGPIDGRHLVRLMRTHLHPQLQRNFIDSWDFSIWPLFVCWSLGAKGVLMRGLHLHPLMIDVTRIDSFESLKHYTVDCRLLGDTLADWTDVQVESDSDNIFMCSLTPQAATHFNPSWFRRFEFRRLHHTAHGPLFTALHRHYFGTAIRLHAVDLDGEWDRLEAQTAWMAEAIRALPGPALRHRPPPWPMRLFGRFMTQRQARRARRSGYRY